MPQVQRGALDISAWHAPPGSLSGKLRDPDGRQRAQIKRGYEWELEVRAATESAWRAQRSQGGRRCITADGLAPGTKYFFRARVGAGTA